MVDVDKAVSISSSRLLAGLLRSEALARTKMGGTQDPPIAPAALSVLGLDGVVLAVARGDDLNHRVGLRPSRTRGEHLPQPALEVIDALDNLLHHDRIEGPLRSVSTRVGRRMLSGILATSVNICTNRSACPNFAWNVVRTRIIGAILSIICERAGRRWGATRRSGSAASAPTPRPRYAS